MGRNNEQYTKLLQSLLPKGKIWNRDEDSILTQVLRGIADEFVREEARVENLYEEKDVTTTTELITEHEEDFGLPEEGEELQPTLALRRNDLHSKLLEVGQQNKEYFEEICEAYGYDITIEYFKPAICGVAVAGDPCGMLINLFYWKILIDVDSVEESIEVNLTNIIAKINRIKPAHTIVLFDFYNAGFSRGFSKGFDRIPHYDNLWEELSFNAGFSNGFSNNTDYYGVNYTGGFNSGFSIGYNRYSGGGFKFGAFSNAFSKPS